ncbi:MAG: D-alanyl-D-alanine carboxypeptidase [Clostridiales bacterium]|jgi:D-alanyl-D-alanine carboxypeptidase|nr:D-alanyl-D-alanine carboxypeptidase [Clostridiales bacterium]
MPSPPEFSAAAVVLMDAQTGLVLYESEGHAENYPASVTKIMTALLVLEHATDLEERIEFCDEAIWSIPRNSSNIGMDVGETLSVRDALYALMLESANEVSVALAIHIAGSVEEFVDLMNRRALQIGAINTHFENPSGLPSNRHVTTAYDMALIMREAVRNEMFTEIISTLRFDIAPTERQSETRHLLNTNRQIQAGPHFNEYVIGGKTGWTSAAGNTLVTYAADENRRLIVSVLQGDGAGTFTDTNALLDYGFALPLETVTVFDASAYSVSVPVEQDINGNPTEIGRTRLTAERDLQFELPPDWSHSWLRYELSVPETLAPPILLGTTVGRVAVFVQDVFVGEVTLTAQDAVFAYTPPVYEEESSYVQNEIIIPQAANEHQFQIFSGSLSFLNNEYIITLAIPLALSLATLFFAVMASLTRHKRRLRRIVRARRARFSRYPHYRYKN